MLHGFHELVVLAGLGGLAILDCTTRRIANWQSFLFATVSVTSLFFGEANFPSCGYSLVALVAAISAWQFDVLGGADVKVLVVLGAVVGEQFVETMLVACCVGFVVCAIVAAWPTQRSSVRKSPADDLPFVAILAVAYALQLFL